MLDRPEQELETHRHSLLVANPGPTTIITGPDARIGSLGPADCSSCARLRAPAGLLALTDLRPITLGVTPGPGRAALEHEAIAPQPGRGRAAAAAEAPPRPSASADGLAAAGVAAFEPAGRPSDVFGGRASAPRRLLDAGAALIHGAEGNPSYGNQLIEQIEELTRGAIVLNPNTMYPLLRELEQRGLIEGNWEHPAEAQPPPLHHHPAGPARVPQPAQGPGAVPRLDHRQHQPHQAGRLRAAAAARRDREQGEKGIGFHGL